MSYVGFGIKSPTGNCSSPLKYMSLLTFCKWLKKAYANCFTNGNPVASAPSLSSGSSMK